MKPLAWLFKWILKAAIFFTLFAFALNNQGDATVHFFFGRQWTAPMVLVVLGAFGAGLLLGVLGMVPRWWHQHRRQPVAAVTAPESAERPPQRPATGQEAYNDATLHGV